MAEKKKEKIKKVTIRLSKKHGFMAFLKLGKQKNDIELTEVKKLRQLLSNEKAKILHTIKESKPKSIYDLAKILKRDFKSVRQDLKLLEHFGMIKLQKQGKRKQKLMPEIAIDKLEITFEI